MATQIYHQNLLYVQWAVSITTIFQYGVICAIVIIHPFYPFIYPKDDYFKKRGFENMVMEYQYSKKFLYISGPLFAISLFFYISSINIIPISSHIIPIPSHIQNIFTFLNNSDVLFFLLSIIVMGIGAILKNLCFFLKKDFIYYFSKGCSMIISTTDDESKKLAYLDLLLNSYNKYLEKTIKIKIKDIDKIYQNIIFLYLSEGKDSILLSIQKNVEKDNLSLFRFISTYILKDLSIDQILINPSFKELFIKRLRQTASILIVAIPLIISIISVYLGYLGKSLGK